MRAVQTLRRVAKGSSSALATRTPPAGLSFASYGRRGAPAFRRAVRPAVRGSAGDLNDLRSEHDSTVARAARVAYTPAPEIGVGTAGRGHVGLSLYRSDTRPDQRQEGQGLQDGARRPVEKDDPDESQHSGQHEVRARPCLERGARAVWLLACSHQHLWCPSSATPTLLPRTTKGKRGRQVSSACLAPDHTGRPRLATAASTGRRPPLESGALERACVGHAVGHQRPSSRRSSSSSWVPAHAHRTVASLENGSGKPSHARRVAQLDAGGGTRTLQGGCRVKGPKTLGHLWFVQQPPGKAAAGTHSGDRRHVPSVGVGAGRTERM